MVYPRACGGTDKAFGKEAALAVYPRACGGTSQLHNPGNTDVGLSPRLRGNPTLAFARFALWPVYPRACGGTALVVLLGAAFFGLSPRLRGNPLGDIHPRPRGRSIPAPAGEPDSLLAPVSGTSVYPRACGGTLTGSDQPCRKRGLSPRLRGNPDDAGDSNLGVRSIPAPAGEPFTLSADTISPSVYPRACGGTLGSVREGLKLLGLSPRLRGNRVGENTRTGAVGSIPRLRGNPSGWRGPEHRVRSIPAPAGEPHPPARKPTYRRSIPAPAGEPARTEPPIISTKVYPRACGGT